MTLHGIHHVTAMCGDPQANVDFYAGLLGLRLVKVTVNYDDPAMYHLYYGDATGSPGSAMTFFPWPSASRGRPGNGQIGVTAFSVPVGSLGLWRARLEQAGVAASPGERFGERFLVLQDPDGLDLEIAEAEDGREPWKLGGIGTDMAVRGFHSVALWVKDARQTAHALTEAMGFRPVGTDGARQRFAMGEARPGAIVDVVGQAERPQGRMGVGTVHHVAWRAADDREQLQWIDRLASYGLFPTPVQDRTYFHSIYFREPGGALFEIATDGPGFETDEELDSLGGSLVLPGWLEPRRQEISARLPRFKTPAGVVLP
jgi:glyoxalase family protein